MKKTLTLAAAALISASAFAQTVTSANIVGYTKVDKPGNTGVSFNIMGITFTSESNKLSELCPVDQFNGSLAGAALADQIIIYTPGAGYTTYAKYDASSYPGYETYVGWQEISDFGFAGTFIDPVLQPGSALWIKTPAGSSSTNVIVAGDVVSVASVTNSVVEGLQLIANPFSDAVKLDDLNLYENATGSLAGSADADQIIVYDPDTQSYETFAFYDARGYGYTNESGWKAISAFQFTDPVTDYELQPGQGFWYKAKSAFTWVETNKYLSAFE